MTVDGVTYSLTDTIPADGVQRKEKTGDTVLAAAKIGQLTTRTDNNTGTLTMAASHGITTGVRIDIYWTESGVNGVQRGVTVGTVSVNSVPFDLGVGDNLPTNLTAITAQVAAEEEFLVTGDNVQFIFAKSNKPAVIVFAESDETEVLAIVLDNDTGGGYQWYTGNGVTNPMAGADVAKVYFTQGDSGGTCAVIAGVGAN